MKAMILAAGLGERMRPLTDTCPKPLLPLGTKKIIEYHLENLAQAGVVDVVINVSRAGDQIQAALGEGERYGVSIQYSCEGERPLGTGLGIFRALPLLGSEPFILLSGDIWTDFSLVTLTNRAVDLVHLVMVDNPAYHLQGDFGLQADGVLVDAEPRLTYANIAVINPQLFAGCSAQESFELAPLLKRAIAQQAASGEHHQGVWHNIGTPEQLAALAAVVTS